MGGLLIPFRPLLSQFALRAVQSFHLIHFQANQQFERALINHSFLSHHQQDSNSLATPNQVRLQMLPSTLLCFCLLYSPTDHTGCNHNHSTNKETKYENKGARHCFRFKVALNVVGPAGYPLTIITACVITALWLVIKLPLLNGF